MASNGMIKIKKGFDIKLKGSAAKQLDSIGLSDVVAVCPSNFIDTIPKLMVSQGDEIKAGDPIFYSKDRPDIKITSPCSGEVIEIKRGEKRRILEIRILADKEIRYKAFDTQVTERSEVIQVMKDAGVWAFLLQRPYNIIADSASDPRAIFISAFDTAPLAPDLDFIIAHRKEAFIKGIEVLKLLGHPLHVGVLPQQKDSEIFKSLESEVELHTFTGKHPAGNVGVQIHHVMPIRKAHDIVWTIHPQDVCVIGELFLTGQYRAERIVNLVGSEVKAPQYYKVLMGTRIAEITQGRLFENKSRIIRGNVLTGKESSADDFLGYYDNQITVIPEVTEPEIFGWLLPGFHKLSASRTFFSWLIPRNEYVLNTSMNGERRNFVVSGEYERVLPMNILPVQLLKAIMARDFEMMEKLGIYEVVEEDLALCEYVCTSKMPVQQILREGLDLMRKEG